MMVRNYQARKGSRLSVQPVTAPEFDIVVRLGRAARPPDEH